MTNNKGSRVIIDSDGGTFFFLDKIVRVYRYSCGIQAESDKRSDSILAIPTKVDEKACAEIVDRAYSDLLEWITNGETNVFDMRNYYKSEE